MKRVNKVLLGIAVVSLLFTSNILSQGQGEGHGKGKCAGHHHGPKAGQGEGFCMGGLNLDDEQKEKVKALRVEHLKAVQETKNLLNEKQAHQKTLMTTDNADMAAIEKNIDEMTALQNKLMKEKAKHRLSVRALLTDEQKILFDQKAGKKCHGKCCAHGGKHGH